MLEEIIKSKTVLAIVGPTASGKTRLALELAKHLPIEIISMDSALIYRGMDIGTAKPDADELAQAQHHLIDILEPTETYSAADFVADAKQLVTEIHARKRLPVLVGGTMMYFRALQDGLATLPSADENLRAEFLANYQHNQAWLHQELSKCDRVLAAKLHPNDQQRLVRALEVFHLTGKPLSQWQAEQAAASWDVNLLKVGILPANRAQLHQQIEKRLQQMFAVGFIAEVENLFHRADLNPDLPAIRCVGYRQAWQGLSGEIAKDEVFEKALAATRQLAKRQITWLRKEEDLLALDPFEQELNQQIAEVLQLLANNLIDKNNP